ncbi:MAG: hypothetical protein ACTSYS_04140, partial [Promethearchaeota archaeon]
MPIPNNFYILLDVIKKGRDLVDCNLLIYEEDVQGEKKTLKFQNKPNNLFICQLSNQAIEEEHPTKKNNRVM